MQPSSAPIALAVLLTLVGVGLTPSEAVAEASIDQIDEADLHFFEQRIRPVLANSCYECHSAAGGEDVKGGLFVDTAKAIRRGGESGPAVVPGEPEESLLLEAISYHGDVKMPPDSKLDDHVIDDFAEWIKRGAPDPREGDRPVPTPIGGDVDPDELWSLSPLTDPAPPTDLPEVAGEAWPTSDIDRFILARLDEAELRPAPPADRRKLIRRAYYDLIGLPPSPEQVQAFIDDDSPDAFEKVIDELLASPRFGERWGRHWLDVARFAESSGGSRSRVYPQAWRYRDYVIESFNEDVPYDQFVREQVAGDLMDYETDAERRRQLIATGFLSLGPKNLDAQDKARQQMDVIDEQLDATGQALMGLTLGCARCHDHMFDPVSIEDYYAMAGVFRSTQTLTPGNINGMVHREIPPTPEQAEAIAAFEQAEEELADAVRTARATERERRIELGVTPRQGPYPLEALEGIVVDNTEAEHVGEWQRTTYRPQYVHENYSHDQNEEKGEKSVTYTPDLPRAGTYEVRLAYNHPGGRNDAVPVIIEHANGTERIEVDQTQEPPIHGIFVSLGEFEFAEGSEGSVTISNEGTSRHVIADAMQFIPRGDIAEPHPFDDEAIAREIDELTQKTQRLEAELAELRDDRPGTPEAMAVRDDADEVGDLRVHINGSLRRLGDVVPRGFPEAIAAELDAELTIPEDQSGRLQLAEWLTHPDHPLTHRVMVNRIWGHLIGQPLVPTPDNFGMRGQPPTHPKLLDYLASRWIEDGYSIKSMIRRIMLSRTYRMAHVEDSYAAETDPENELLWRAHRRRLDAEAMRDAMLAVSGDLDLTMYGDTLEGRTGDRDDYSPDSDRRSVYLAVFRSALPEFLEVFDLADPNLVSGKRTVSTVPTQSLYLLNSPFMHERAASLAQRVMELDGDDTDRVDWLYEALLSRPPQPGERNLAEDLLDHAGDEPADRLDAYRQLSHALLASLEFRYLE